MSGVGDDIDVNSLFAKPKWWAVTAITWISVVVLVIGAIMSFTEASSVYSSAADSERSAFAKALAAIFQFVWYFVSSCFWALLVICAGRGLEKLDQLVWLQASEADRKEIVRRRVATKSRGGWRAPESNS